MGHREMKEWETRRDGDGVREKEKDREDTETGNLVKCGVRLAAGREFGAP